MRNMLARFTREDGGQDLIEYALLGGIIVVLTAGIITTIGNRVLVLFTSLNSAIGG